MLSRRDFLQVAAATAALLPERFDARARAAASDPRRVAALRGGRQRDPRSHRRYPRPARAAPVPRARGQSRRRRSEGAGAACQRQGAARPLPDHARLGRRLRIVVGGLRGIGQEAMAAWAGSTASPPSSTRSVPSAATGWCCSTAATPGRTATPRCSARVRTWSTAWHCCGRMPWSATGSSRSAATA